MVYEMALGTTALDVHVWREPEDSRPDRWRVEAHNGRQPAAVVVGKSGATRLEALQEVGRAWNASELGLGLPTYDWDAVAALLSSVRAV